MKHWFRRLLRRCRIDLPFTDVVCPLHVKSLRIQAGAAIEIIDRRSLVFLDRPEPDDLRDVVPMAVEGDGVPYHSPDGVEFRRTSTRKGTQIWWMPREPIVPYALYVHQYGWLTTQQRADAVVYNQFRCEMRTGIVELEILTSGQFEAGVAFKRPRWRRLTSERSLMKYALTQLDAGGEPPVIADGGARAVWRLVGPTVGDRYVYVAFETNGVEVWRKRLAPKSLVARLRRLITSPLASS